jgi:hypothetical protein
MIRRRLMLIAAPLCVVSVVASVAFASTPDTEHSSDAELDKLHVERPTAASDRSDLGSAWTTANLRVVAQRQAERQAARASFLAGLEAARAVEVELAARAFAASLAPQRPAPEDSGGSATSDGSSGDALACIRAHESDTSGGYQAVSAGGTYRGAYQFLQSTWDNAAGAAGRADLVGADPASVAPADQDAVAAYLYSQVGSQPWGGRC